METETNKRKQPLVLYRGISVEFTDVTFKIAIRQLFELDLLETEPGGTVGICGDGSNLVSSLLSKIITQNSGDIKLNGVSYCESNAILFGFVPFNPKIDGVTIR